MSLDEQLFEENGIYQSARSILTSLPQLESLGTPYFCSKFNCLYLDYEERRMTKIGVISKIPRFKSDPCNESMEIEYLGTQEKESYLNINDKHVVFNKYSLNHLWQYLTEIAAHNLVSKNGVATVKLFKSGFIFDEENNFCIKREMQYFDGITIGEFSRHFYSTSKKYLNCLGGVFEKIVTNFKKIHDLGIIHRDINQKNILINHDREIAIIDFGVSKILDKEKLEQIEFKQLGLDERLKDIVGQDLEFKDITYGGYGRMAPEIARLETTGTKESDLFSLGILLYELLLNKTAFEKPKIQTMLNYRNSTRFNLIYDLIGRLYLPKTTRRAVGNSLLSSLNLDPQRRNHVDLLDAALALQRI